MLKFDEGCKNTVYWDTEGYPTIGIGHLIIKKETRDPVLIYSELDKQTGTTERILSPETILKLFKQDIDKLRKEIAKNKFLYDVYITLDDVRKSAIENMCFQLGVNGVSKFKNMINSLSKKDYSSAYNHGLDSSWYKQTPNRALRVMTTLKYGDYRSYNFK